MEWNYIYIYGWAVIKRGGDTNTILHRCGVGWTERLLGIGDLERLLLHLEVERPLYAE